MAPVLQHLMSFASATMAGQPTASITQHHIQPYDIESCRMLWSNKTVRFCTACVSGVPMSHGRGGMPLPIRGELLTM